MFDDLPVPYPHSCEIFIMLGCFLRLLITTDHPVNYISIHLPLVSSPVFFCWWSFVRLGSSSQYTKQSSYFINMFEIVALISKKGMKHIRNCYRDFKWKLLTLLVVDVRILWNWILAVSFLGQSLDYDHCSYCCDGGRQLSCALHHSIHRGNIRLADLTHLHIRSFQEAYIGELFLSTISNFTEKLWKPNVCWFF